MYDTFPPGWFVTGVGTGIGKTFLSRGLTCAMRGLGASVVALKPLETGATPDPHDARALAAACAQPELASAPGLYRARPALCPYGATLSGEAPPPPIADLAARIRELAAGHDTTLVEGAGGLLVPLDAEHTVADLARAVALPLLLVACDRLGVLSDVLACCEAASTRRPPIAAVILTQHERSPADTSHLSNQRILRERLGLPVVQFPRCDDDNPALAAAVHASGLLTALALPGSPAKPANPRIERVD